MKNLVLFALLLVPSLAGAKEITIVNECPKPIFVAVAGTSGGGSDGLNDSGSYSWNWSNGWRRIGPFQRENVDGQYLRVQNGTTPLSAVSGGGIFGDEELVNSFCFNPNTGNSFDFKHFKVDNTGRNRAVDNLVAHCLRIGGRWGAFEKIKHTWNTYTVYANSCNKAAPDPAQLRSRYQRDPQGDNVGMTFYKVHPAANEWVQFNTKDKSFRLLREERTTPESIVLLDSGYNVRYALFQGTTRYLNNNTNEWRTFGGGRWYSEFDDRPTNGIVVGGGGGMPVVDPPSTTLTLNVDSRVVATASLPARVKVVRVEGEWTVDANKPKVNPLAGHNDPQLEQFSQYKLDRRFRFGALIVASGQGWLQVQVGQVYERGDFVFRINDSDQTLGDNIGAIRVIFEKVP